MPRRSHAETQRLRADIKAHYLAGETRLSTQNKTGLSASEINTYSSKMFLDWSLSLADRLKRERQGPHKDARPKRLYVDMVRRDRLDPHISKADAAQAGLDDEDLAAARYIEQHFYKTGA